MCDVIFILPEHGRSGWHVRAMSKTECFEVQMNSKQNILFLTLAMVQVFFGPVRHANDDRALKQEFQFKKKFP